MKYVVTIHEGVNKKVYYATGPKWTTDMHIAREFSTKKKALTMVSILARYRIHATIEKKTLTETKV